MLHKQRGAASERPGTFGRPQRGGGRGEGRRGRQGKVGWGEGGVRNNNDKIMLFGLAASSEEHFRGNPGKLSKHICFALQSVSGMRQRRRRPDDKPAVYYQGSTLKPSHQNVLFFFSFAAFRSLSTLPTPDSRNPVRPISCTKMLEHLCVCVCVCFILFFYFFIEARNSGSSPLITGQRG